MASSNSENAARLSIEEISNAIAEGLGRAVQKNEGLLRDRILIYGGRLDFNIRAIPERVAGSLEEVAKLG